MLPGREVLVELGISAGADVEADLRTRRADAPQQAVTQRILALADEAGYRAALIDAVTQGSGEASVITWPQFARMVRAAARGLSRRGLRKGDTAGVFVHDAVSHVVAVHAVRTAGAIAAPVRPAPASLCPAQAAVDIAAQLKECRARLLITSAALADLAIQAAERSLVRQVFAFGEAEGTTPFGSLLHTARHSQVHRNGSTGLSGGVSHGGSTDRDRPEGPPDGGAAGPPDGGAAGPPDGVAAADGDVVAHILDLAGLGPDGPTPPLTSRDVVVAAPPCGDPDAYTSLLDLALTAGAAIVAVPLPQVAAAVRAYKGTAAIVPRGTEVPGLSASRLFAVG
jgi:non-ribosomal peptide synthetase component F